MSGLKELAKRRILVYCLACFACLTAWLALATWVPAAAQTTDKTSAQPESAPHEQVDAAYQRGMKLLQEKRYNDALEQFRLVEQRSEEHTSELQSRLHLVCRLLLEK